MGLARECPSMDLTFGNAPRAFICGLEGGALTRDERSFLRHFQPAGLIVFARNVEAPAQLGMLCADIAQCLERARPAIFIDQEGGRVQRLRPPHFGAYPPAAEFGALYAKNPARALVKAEESAFAMGRELATHGISVACAPVLDVPVDGSHGVIGDRAFSSDPLAVAALGKAFVTGLRRSGIVPVIKHCPGHGRARVDSHHGLPVVDCARFELEATDCVPFKALCAGAFARFFAMSAHVVFSAIDAENPATHSARVIKDIIRGHIGFAGVLLSDDIAMAALSGTLQARARRAYAAGIDLVLHCSGDLAESEEIARAAPPFQRAALQF